MLPCLCLASGASLASFPCCIAPASVPSLHAHHPASSLCVISSSWKHTSLWVWGPPNAAWGFPGGSVVKNLPACRRHGFDPWVRKVPWRRKWQPTPLFLLGKSNGQRSRGATVHGVIKDSDTTEQLNNNEHDLLLSNSFEKHLTSVIFYEFQENVYSVVVIIVFYLCPVGPFS